MQKILSKNAKEMEKTLHESQGCPLSIIRVEEYESIELRNKRELLPPFDATTKKTEEIYKLNDVVPHEELEAMDISEDIAVLKKPKVLAKHKDL